MSKINLTNAQTAVAKKVIKSKRTAGWKWDRIMTHLARKYKIRNESTRQPLTSSWAMNLIERKSQQTRLEGIETPPRLDRYARLEKRVSELEKTVELLAVGDKPDDHIEPNQLALEGGTK